MILGRSTVQWTSLISAAGGLSLVLIVNLFRDVDPIVAATVIGSVVTFLGVFVAFLANTQTTLTKDPQLEQGTLVRVTNATGTVIGHEAVPTPALPEPGPGTPGVPPIGGG